MANPNVSPRATTAAEHIATERVISGVVEHGRKLGRTLGFPTANVTLLEGSGVQHGVYAVRCRVDGGPELQGVASLGCNPTIPKARPVLEVWLFDFEEEIYGRTLETRLVRYLRGEQKFASVEALREQVFRDADEARRYFSFC